MENIYKINECFGTSFAHSSSKCTLINFIDNLHQKFNGENSTKIVGRINRCARTPIYMTTLSVMFIGSLISFSLASQHVKKEKNI